MTKVVFLHAMSARTLYVFNPEHDLALGHGGDFYQAPASALQMADDLSALPAWLAEPGDVVCVSSVEAATRWQRDLPVALPVGWVSWQDAPPQVGLISPWGWDRALVHRLRAWGVKEECLPSPERLERLRQASSRLRAVELLRALQVSGRLCGYSRACRSPEEIAEALAVPHSLYEVTEEKKFLKAPWSGSGKGLRWGSSLADAPLANWCRRVLAAQGQVVVEPIYNKVYDFAMEFRADGQGGVRFFGYSLFETDRNGVYRGNCLMSDERIVGRLSAYVDSHVLDEVRGRLERELAERLPAGYNGFLGVDMMVCCFESAPYYRVHPCVEINLRLNMGVVAHVLADRLLAPGSEGVFRINYAKEPGTLWEEYCRQNNARRVLTTGGRVREGYVALTPVTPDTYYRAVMEVHPVNG